MSITQQIIQNILGDMTVVQFLTYLVLGLTGMLASMLMEVYKYIKAIKNSEGFSLLVYIKENRYRGMLAFVFMLIGIIFTKQVLNVDINTFVALLAGYCTDNIADSLAKRKTT